MAYKKIILDESLLDIDSWLPEEAFRELAQVVLEVNNDMFTDEELIQVMNPIDFRKLKFN